MIRRLLVVDDNVDSADTLAQFIALHGLEVRTAYTGPAALAVAGQFDPDVVILAIDLPGLNGYEVARQLRSQTLERSCRQILVALTGYSRPEDRQLAFEAGFDHHLVKPAYPHTLLQLLGLSPSD